MPSGPRICADRGDLLFLTNAEVHCGASRTPPLEPRPLRERAYRQTVPGGAPDDGTLARSLRGRCRGRGGHHRSLTSAPGTASGRGTQGGPGRTACCLARSPTPPPVARPQPPVGTHRPPSVLPLRQSVHVPARRCVSRKREPGPSPRERRLGESSLGDTARLHRLLLGGLQSPRPQEELEMCSSRRDPRGAGHVTGTTCCSARHSHRRRPAPGSGLAAAAGTPGGPGPDPRARTAERPAAPATSASCGCRSLRSGG